MRRKRAPKRQLLADPKYGSQLLSKFINHIMVDGKRSLAQRIVYKALEHAASSITDAQIVEKLLEFDKSRAVVGLSSADDHDDDDGDGGEGGSSSISVKPMSPQKKPLLLLEYVLDIIRPKVEVKSRRVGGATYQIPIEVDMRRGLSLAMRWLHQFSKKRGEKSMILRVANEIIDACHGRGAALKKRDDTHRMAKANQAFAHYRW